MDADQGGNWLDIANSETHPFVCKNYLAKCPRYYGSWDLLKSLILPFWRFYQLMSQSCWLEYEFHIFLLDEKLMAFIWPFLILSIATFFENRALPTTVMETASTTYGIGMEITIACADANVSLFYNLSKPSISQILFYW